MHHLKQDCDYVNSIRQFNTVIPTASPKADFNSVTLNASFDTCKANLSTQLLKQDFKT